VKYLSLYVEPQLAAVELSEAMPTDSQCDLCPHHQGVHNVCMSPEGNDEKGGLLIVGDHPLLADDARGRPFSSAVGAKLRRIVREHWSGPVYLDYALKCAPAKGKLITEKQLRACRGYLAETIRETKPSKIITLGTTGMKGVLGRGGGALSTRKAFGWLEQSGVPVFTLMGAYFALNNRFLTEWFEEDLAWAIAANVDALRAQSSREGVANLITSAAESKLVVSSLREEEWVAYDTETVGRTFNADFEVISIAVSAKDSEDAFVWTGSVLKDKAAMKPLLDMFADSSVKKVAQNAKYDANAMYAFFGVSVRGLHIDTRLVRKLLEPESVSKLEVLQESVGMGGGKEIAEEQIKKVVRRIRKHADDDLELADIGPLPWVRPIAERTADAKAYAYGLIDKDTMNRYCGRDAVSTARLGELFEDRLEAEPTISNVWDTIMLPAARAIEHVERWGILVDRDAIKSFAEVVVQELEEATAKIYVKGKFNINSTRELCEVLYNKYKLPILNRTATGNPSTDKATLDLLATKNLSVDQKEFVDAMLTFRKVSKLHTTYATKLEGFILGDGRIHCSFDLVGARSGRISCKSPNTQQIPRADTETSAMARDCFVAPAGRTLVQLDYSQLELRVVAMLSGDENMIQVFKSGVDYHLRTAQLVSKQAWGIEPEEVTKVHRSMAKRIGFGLLYGMGAATLAKDIGITTSEAEKIQKAIFGNFPKMKRWCDEQLKFTRLHGYTRTFWGGEPARKRPLFGIASADDKARSTAENSSFNTPVQGSASDMCLASLARCVNWILETDFPAKLVLTVHDSLMFEVDDDKVAALIAEVRTLMCDWPNNGVPLVVDVEIGKSWGQLKSI
jgi:uracil-DNA glycosylase family 4